MFVHIFKTLLGLTQFVQKVEQVLRGERAVTVVLDDPAGNSYVQSLADEPNVPDAGLKITRYERTLEQNEELGINDMRTEDYQPTDTPASECESPSQPTSEAAASPEPVAAATHS